MCQFKSAIVVRDLKEKGGFRLLMSPWTESHSELCTIFRLNDGKMLHFARVEFSPADLDTAYKVETYKLKIDEERKPDWFDDEMKENVAQRMTDYIQSIIVSGEVELLIGGQFIIAPTAKIEYAHGMVINAMCGGAVREIMGGTVDTIRGGTIGCISGGMVNDIHNSTTNVIRGGIVNIIWGGTVNNIIGMVNYINGVKVGDISGGMVNDINGGTVNNIWHGAVINQIHPSATILKDNRAKVKKQ